MLYYVGMKQNGEFHIDFDLPTVEAKRPAVHKMHISDSVCESCEG